MKESGLLVDLDGTLADTASLNAKAYAESLMEVGVSIQIEEFCKIAHGKNWRQFLPEVLAKFGSSASPTFIADRKREIYTARLVDVGINEALVSLVRQVSPVSKTALVTTASRFSTEKLLSIHNLVELFDVVITGDDVTHHKPNPEPYLIALSRLSLAASRCIAFEDSDIGEASAEAAGLQVVRISFP